MKKKKGKKKEAVPTVVLTLFPSTAAVFFSFFFVFFRPFYFLNGTCSDLIRTFQEFRLCTELLRYLGGFVRDDASYECL